MRNIDADELIKTYEKETGYSWNAKGILECPKCFIDDAPTVELERPQGKWVITGTEQGAVGMVYTIRKCSNCGFEHSLCIPDYFCPNCGASMTRYDKNENSN